MSIALQSLVWQTDFPGHEKLVLLALADWANDDGVCWPHQEKIAAHCSCSERNVRKIISSLEVAGYIKKENRRRGGIQYHLQIDEIKKRNHSSAYSTKKAEPQFHIKQDKEKNKRNHSSGESGTTVPVYIEPSRTTNISPPKKPAATMSDHSWFTSWWCYSVEQITGEKYVYSKKSAGQVKQLLSGLDLVGLVERACAYLMLNPRDRFPKGQPDLGGLQAMINQLAGAFNDDIDDRFLEAGLLPEVNLPLRAFQPWQHQKTETRSPKHNPVEAA